MELERPAAHFLVLLTHIAFVPLHPSLVSAGAPWDNARTLVSDGPFHLVSRTADEMVLEKNLRYWDARNVGFDRVRVRFYDDAKTATEDYLAGRVHWSTIGDYDLVTDPDQFEAFPMFSTSYFFFACDAAPWSDTRVRRALALLVAWNEVRGEDLIFPTSRLVPSIGGYPEVKGIEERDAAKARSLLAEAGFPGGRGLPKLVISVFGGSAAVEAARAMAATWNLELGLETDIREADGDEYFAGIRAARLRARRVHVDRGLRGPAHLPPAVVDGQQPQRRRLLRSGLRCRGGGSGGHSGSEPALPGSSPTPSSCCSTAQRCFRSTTRRSPTSST